MIKYIETKISYSVETEEEIKELEAKYPTADINVEWLDDVPLSDRGTEIAIVEVYIDQNLP